MKSPLVSIGMPVFNEDRFIRSALESLVKQTYDNLEIKIFDNCSTDDTAIICEEFAKRYEFVTFTQHSENIGAAANFKYAQENAGGDYFMWAAGHDLWSPNLIEECVHSLETNPEAAISFASSVWIDTNSVEIKDRQSGWTDTRGLSAIARFHTCLWGNMHPILGVIRQKHLAKSKPFQGILGADLIVLSELALLGDFVHSPLATWSRRHFRQKESYTQRVKRYKSNEYKLLDKSLINAFPALKLAFELVRVVVRADISFFPKTFTLITLVPTMALKYFTSVNEK